MPDSADITRDKIARQLMRGVPLDTIAKRLGLTRRTVQRYRKELQREWAKAADDPSKTADRDLAVLEHVISEALLAWDDSADPKLLNAITNAVKARRDLTAPAKAESQAEAKALDPPPSGLGRFNLAGKRRG